MKLLLISANVTLSPYPIYPLGVSMIAAALTRAGHEVRQADLLLQHGSMEAIGREIEQFRPDLVGISVRNIDNVNFMNEQYYIQNVKNIVDKVREVSDVKVILGGAGFSLIPDLILEETGADYGVVGEGEVLIVEFANNAAKGIYPRERLIGSAERLSGEQIKSALYDEQLLDFYLHSGNIASIQTKRGCAYKCVYCTYPLLEGSELRRIYSRGFPEPPSRIDRVVPAGAVRSHAAHLRMKTNTRISASTASTARIRISSRIGLGFDFAAGG